MDRVVLEKLKLPDIKIKLSAWENFVAKVKNPQNKVNIAVCGKYTDYLDAYKSISEAFIHAGAENDTKVNVIYISAEEMENKEKIKNLENIDGLLVPGGFGERGVEGKIKAIQYARENNIPFFGICLGMQCAIIEYARNVCGIKNANSSEFVKNKYSVVDIMPEQKKIRNYGGTMRLGAYPCKIEKNSKAYMAYQCDEISERHRHRYEVNNDFRKPLEEKGVLFSGLSPDGRLVEIAELPQLRWFLGCQFHPELKSRAIKAHPLFREFVKASLEYSKEKKL
jgi:CTP synthase